MVVDATTSPSCVETVSTRIALTETVTVSLCSPSSSVTLICTALSASTADARPLLRLEPVNLQREVVPADRKFGE